MTIYLYQIETDTYPEGVGDPEEMLLVHEEGADPECLNIGELNFITTLGIRSENPEETLSEFKNWWQGNAGSQIGLELITKESMILQDVRREEIESLDEGEWSMQTNFIAYSRASEEAYLSAQKIIQESELKVQ